MFNSENNEITEKVNYTFRVENVRKTKNDKILMIDLDVNGVKIYSCIFKEVTVKNDGKKYKAGDTCYMLTFPSEKVNDKYYDRVWCPVSKANMDSIIEQIKEKLT